MPAKVNHSSPNRYNSIPAVSYVYRASYMLHIRSRGTAQRLRLLCSLCCGETNSSISCHTLFRTSAMYVCMYVCMYDVAGVQHTGYALLLAPYYLVPFLTTETWASLIRLGLIVWNDLPRLCILIRQLIRSVPEKSTINHFMGLTIKLYP